MNPIRLTLALLISLFTGLLLLLISAPYYYKLIFTAGSTVQLSLSPLQSSSFVNSLQPQPLLIGMLLGGIVSVALYNMLRFIYTRYQRNLLFGIALSFLLMFSLFLINRLGSQADFFINSNNGIAYIPIVLGVLFLHAVYLYDTPKYPPFNKVRKQLSWHMVFLGLGAASLLALTGPYAHLLTYFLLISSAVILLGSTLCFWEQNYLHARTLFAGFSILFLTLIALWPYFIYTSFLSPDSAVLYTLIGLSISAVVISTGISKAHFYQMRKNTNASRESAAKEAESRAKTELLAKISHEIRTPLSGVLGMTSLLLDTPLSSKQRDYAQTIQGSGNDLLGMINEILDISDLESNKIVLNHIQFNLVGLLQECTQAFSSAAQEQQVELTVFLQPQVPETLLGSPERLQQILLSILKNSFQRTHNGEVTLSTTIDQYNETPQLIFNVQDTGTPLSDEERHILCTAQPHSKDLLSASFIGGNLGIVIARQLVILMNGTFRILQSTQGTVFKISIPFTPQHNQISQDEAVSILRNKHILIIDSNALSQKVLTQQCAEWGLIVTACSSPTDAVALLRNKAMQGQHFAAALISETIHKPSAISFAIRIKEDPILTADTHLIMLSSSNKIDYIAARNAGISNVLMKPVSGSTLKIALITAAQLSLEYAKPLQSLAGKRVLVAEDDTISVKVISGLLSKLGVSIEVAANGQIALDMLQKNHYDLVLMDCEMPVMDGFTAAKKHREYELIKGLKPTPIIALSAHVLEEHQMRAKKSGMNGHLAKPIELTKLKAVLMNN